MLSTRPLGSSGLEVSVMSLGSWRTFERIPAQTGIAVLGAARDQGINREGSIDVPHPASAHDRS